MVKKHKPDLVGQRIKRLRESRGLTQYELAEKAGITQALLSQIENGVRHGLQLRLEAIIRLAHELHVGVGELSGTWMDYQGQESEFEPADDALVAP